MTPVVTFFNNKGGVGQTSLVYHLAWMYAELGTRVVAVDLDPQANLTAAFLDEDELEALWPATGPGQTVFGSISPLLRGIGDIAATSMREIDERLALAPGDLSLSRFEDELSSQWPDCLDGKERAFRVISAFRRLIIDGAEQFEADLVLVDVGPNLGAINRAALVAADHVVVPLAPDLFSLQGLRNLGPTLRRWREEWQARVPRNPDPDLELPPGGCSRPATCFSNTAYAWDVPSAPTSAGWTAFRESTVPMSSGRAATRRHSMTTRTASPSSSITAA